MTVNVVLIRGYVFSVLSEYCFFARLSNENTLKKPLIVLDPYR